MAKFKMYLTGICPYCHLAERYLKSKGVIEIEKIRIDQDPEAREEMMRITGRRTVPQIFAGTTHIGGYDDLVALDQDGGLAPFLEQEE
ncbi:MAG: glutaredoxin 3 [Pseudomonadota bacterium]|jgi:glutaredoxin 3